MKALSLWQPWASLIALGVKTIETRSWATNYRGPLAIHAGLRRPEMMHLPPLRGRDEAHNRTTWLVCDTITDPAHQRPHRTDIPDRVPKRSQSPTLFFPHDGTYPLSSTGFPPTLVLPLGAVVATCTLVECELIGDADTLRNVRRDPDGLYLYDGPSHRKNISDQDPFGDFRHGRWAWLLADIEPLAEPVPVRGHQGLWEWVQ